MAAEANNVTLSTNFNVSPYYDDFDESKNFHRILFRPGLAVQARELTQMQTILQNQIDRFASHIFREGSTVQGLETNYDTRYSFVKLRNNNSTGNTVTVSDFSNKIVKGATSGVLGIVVKVKDGSESTSPNYKTLYVKYIAANNSTGYRFFANNEIIRTVGGGTIYSANSITSGATGFGAAVTFNTGIVYAKDHFIRVPEQTVLVSNYQSTTASARVGFDITETIVTETTDESLLDPASGSYNYAAPGAARLKLTANVRSVALTATVSNTFVELFQVKDGVVQSISTRPQYSQIRDYIAKRTADESGDYVVNGFEINVKEHLKTGNNQGVLTSAEGGNNQLLVVFAEPGKAYVKGYDIERIATIGRNIQKATDSEAVQSAKALVDYGNYVIVDNVVGNWDVNQQSIVSLRSAQADAVSSRNYSTTVFSGSQIGTARVRGIEYYSGTPGLPSAQYKLYLTDVTMAAGQSFTAVQSIGYNGGGSTVYGKADIVGSNGLNANTSDPLFDRAVFRLPAQAIKRLRTTSGTVRNDYSFYVSNNVSFTTGGIATLTLSDGTFDGSGVLSDAATRTDFYVVSRGYANTTTFSETLSTTNGSNTITASATIDGKVNPGDAIYISSVSNTFIVSTVSGSTITTLGPVNGVTGSGKSFFKRFFPGQVLDFAGVGKDGARSINITSSTGATFDINETLTTTLSATIVSTLNKINGQEQSKSVQRNRLVQIHVGSNRGGSGYTANTTGPWSLGLSDGFKLISVRKKSSADFASATEGTDVTSHFTLDSGMLDSYYSHSRLVKKSSSALSIASGDRLLVKFDYFTHGVNPTGFFSYDSYPVDDATAATNTSKIFTYEIPVYISPSTGISYDLRDCVDFRPRMTDTANSVTVLSSSTIATNPKTSNTFVLPSGGLHFSPTGQDFTTDLEYYLRRVDIIGLNTDGSLVVTKGVPAVRPATPPAPNDVMAMASIELAPYPSLPPVLARRVGRPDQANKFRKFNNRRYTMRDIGKIAERIDRLEYYTSLTLLELSAQDLLVQDANGLDRFKNGILVDSFTTHAVGNVFDLDYKVAIDPTKGEMRPRFTNDETPLVMTANSANVVRTNVTPAGLSRDQVIVLSSTPSSSAFLPGTEVKIGSTPSATIRHRVGNKLYVEDAIVNFAAGATVVGNRAVGGSESANVSSVTATTAGKLVTLPYSHKILVNQPYATTTRNCAGAIWNFVGTLTLLPDNDYWCDTVEGPDTNITIDLNTDSWEYLASTWPANWNAPITSFTGSPVLVGSATNNVGGTYAVTQIDGSQIIYQDTQTQNYYATPTITTQTGEQTGIGFVTTTASYGNIVVDTSIIPYMRSRQILFKMQGMMPSIRVYGFFDGVDVNAYVTPLTEAEFTSGLKTITGAPITPAAAAGSAFVTDAYGTAYGAFQLPNDSSLKFRTGAKRLRFTDNPTNSGSFGQLVTSCEATYTAEGLAQTVSSLTVTTKSVEITQSALNSTTYGSSSSVTTSSGQVVVGTIPAPEEDNDDGGDWVPPEVPAHGDPIGQSFFINSILSTKTQTSGMYLTKFDLFFASKDNIRSVTIDIREVDPLTSAVTMKVVPYSRVTLTSAEVNTSADSSAATPVYFPSPVHLSNETEYAIVITPESGSPYYSVYTAVLGGKDLIDKSIVSEQPAAGVLFVSANQRVFQPEQKEDLKFTAYYAEFNKSTVGTLIVKNPARDHLTIANTTGALSSIGEVVHGQTRLVGTFTPGNGLKGNTATGNSFVQGMTSGATGKIVSVSANHVVVRDVSTGAKFRGGEAVRFRLGASPTTSPLAGNSTGGITSATYPVGRVTYYDAINYANTRLIVANTSYVNSGVAFANARAFATDTYIKGQTSGYNARIVTINNVAIDNMNLITNMIVPSNNQVRAFAKMATSTSARDSSFFRVNINGDTELSSPRYVLSRSIESNTSASSATMATNRSLEIKYEIDGRNIVASPAIDLDRIALYHTHNLISTNAAIGSSEDYVKFGGNAETRYITRIVGLADGQDAEDLRVYLTAYKPSGSNIFVYYKILAAEDNDSMADVRWIPMELNESQGFTAATRYSSSENKNDFLELVYDVPNYTNTARSGANNSTGIIEYRNSARAAYSKFKYFAIKIVLTNSTSSNPPRVKDLRAIALMI
jgi:hypothetical protein